MGKENMVGIVPGQAGLGADDCLGLIGDIITKVRGRVITKRQLELFAQGKNPFAAPNRLTVNGGDPRWKSIRKEDYYFINSGLSAADFPVVPGSREVAYDVDTFDHQPTTEEVRAWQHAPGFRAPDRAEVETYLDEAPDSKAELGNSPIVGLCGIVTGGDVACVYANGVGRFLFRGQLVGQWDQSCRFLRVRK